MLLMMLTVVFPELGVLVALADIILLRLVACQVIESLVGTELRRTRIVFLDIIRLLRIPNVLTPQILVNFTVEHSTVEFTVAQSKEGLALQGGIGTRGHLLEHLYGLLVEIDLIDTRIVINTLGVVQQPPAVAMDAAWA